MRVEWRLNEIERKIETKAESYKVDSLSSDVGRLEYSLREACSDTNGLRAELESALYRINQLERRLDELGGDQ